MSSPCYNIGKKSGHIELYRADVVNDLIADCQRNILNAPVCCSNQDLFSCTPPRGDGRARSAPTVSCPPLPFNKEKSNWLSSYSIRKLQSASDPDCKDTEEMCQHLLVADDVYNRDIEEFLAERGVNELRRRELLHRKWIDNVYRPIRREVQRELESVCFDELIRRRRRVYKDYLEYSNRKNVFLDIREPSEYYCMGPQPGKPYLLTAETPPLNDPLLLQEHQRLDEDGVTIRCCTGQRQRRRDIQAMRQPCHPLVPLGRHGTQWGDWRDMHLYCIESEARQKERKKMNPNKNSSQIVNNEFVVGGRAPVNDLNKRRAPPPCCETSCQS